MGWLSGLVLASLAGAWLTDKIVGTIFGGILGPIAVAIKNSIFVGTWTAITTGLGIRDIKKASRNLRGKKEADAHIDPPLKGKRRIK